MLMGPNVPLSLTSPPSSQVLAAVRGEQEADTATHFHLGGAFNLGVGDGPVLLRPAALAGVGHDRLERSAVDATVISPN